MLFRPLFYKARPIEAMACKQGSSSRWESDLYLGEVRGAFLTAENVFCNSEYRQRVEPFGAFKPHLRAQRGKLVLSPG